jgi:hypothetical protein
MAERRDRTPVKLCDICNRRMSYLASLPVGAPFPLQRAYKCLRCNFATVVACEATAVDKPSISTLAVELPETKAPLRP